MRRVVDSMILLLVLPVLLAADPPEEPFAFPPPQRLTIAFAGDLLMHKPLVDAARDTATGEYDFNPLFEYVAPYLGSADYTVANLETRLAGAARGYSGYPCFNSPASLADALRDAGVDLLATANNHSLDKGYDGLNATLDHLEQAGLAHVGTYRSAAAQDKPFIAQIQGVPVAFLNYTYGTNGIALPRGKEYAVNLIAAEQIIAEAAAAREQGAALVVAFLHFGAEYQRRPNVMQRGLAQKLCEQGVDAVIGAHPHVVQPVEWYTADEQAAIGPAGCTCPIAYSLGNFVSNQRSRYRDSGIIVYLEIEQAVDRVRIVSLSYLPVYVRKYLAAGRWQYAVLPVHPDIALDLEPPLTSAERSRMDQVWDELTEHLGSDDEVLAVQPVDPAWLAR